MSDETPTVRLARPDELTEVGEITARAYADFVLGPDDPYLDRLRGAAARARDAELWVAEAEGVLLGTVTRTPAGSPWREVAADGEGEFRMLAVSPEARGRGVASALVDHVVALCRADGDTAVVLSSLTEMHTAHRIYDRAGFRRTPVRDWDPVPGVHLITYRLELT